MSEAVIALADLERLVEEHSVRRREHDTYDTARATLLDLLTAASRMARAGRDEEST